MDDGAHVILDEIAATISEALGRFGVAGDVSIEHPLVVLDSAGFRVTADLGQLPRHWDVLPGDERNRRCSDIARRLVEARRALTGSLKPPPPRKLGWLLTLAVLLVLALVSVAAFRLFGPRLAALLSAAPEPSEASTAPAGEADAESERAATVCAAAATRALRGATLGIADADGWAIDILLLRSGKQPSPIDDPALARFIVGPKDLHRLVWPQVPSLKAVEGPSSHIELSDFALPPTGEPRLKGLVVSFSGRYATPYFDERGRQEYVNLAHSMSDAFAADHAALGARCLDSKEHHAGAWFRSSTPASAASILVYFMGLDADSPHLRQDLMQRPGGALDYDYALANIENATRRITYEELRTLIGPYGGSIAGPAKGPSTLVFDFKDSGRATRTSRAIARKVGLDSGQ